MKTVNIAELKAHLSAHIQLVRQGEEVLVCDRNKPVARIVPCRLEGQSEQEQRLVANGLLRLPLDKRPASVSWPTAADLAFMTAYQLKDYYTRMGQRQQADRELISNMQNPETKGRN